jgi:large subunit ribosomal protein L25
MSEIRTLTAAKRDRAGKGSARAARRAGFVPAVIYGNKKDPVMVQIEERLIKREMYKPGFFTHLFDIDVDGKSERALARDLQLDPVTDLPVHVDFLRVSKKTTVSVAVPVHFVNEEQCPGITKGGVLNIVRHEVEIDAAADAIPEHIEVDLSGFDTGDSIHISAVKLPKGASSTIQDRDFTIATIVAPSGLKAEIAAEGEEGEVEEEEGGEE